MQKDGETATSMPVVWQTSESGARTHRAISLNMHVQDTQLGTSREANVKQFSLAAEPFGRNAFVIETWY